MSQLQAVLTALPGDFYLRLPLLAPLGVQRLIDDDLVMVDGLSPEDFGELESLEPEEDGVGQFPIVVRTILALEKSAITDWLQSLVPSVPDPGGARRRWSDDDIAGVLYWGTEARWRLRRICVGRYSRFDDLEDTSELDTTGAFRDWLLVQGTQSAALTLYRQGWMEYNTTDLPQLLAFVQRSLVLTSELVALGHPSRLQVPPSVDRKELERRISRLTTAGRGQEEWVWEL